MFSDNELTRLSDDVKVMICLLLAPRDLVSLSGVNKTLRQFVHVNASRMVRYLGSTIYPTTVFLFQQRLKHASAIAERFRPPAGMGVLRDLALQDDVWLSICVRTRDNCTRNRYDQA